jgi:hypothetical protein
MTQRLFAPSAKEKSLLLPDRCRGGNGDGGEAGRQTRIRAAWFSIACCGGRMSFPPDFAHAKGRIVIRCGPLAHSPKLSHSLRRTLKIRSRCDQYLATTGVLK